MVYSEECPAGLFSYMLYVTPYILVCPLFCLSILKLYSKSCYFNFFPCVVESLSLFYLLGRLSYLHEGLEPKVVHRDIKSSNILLDKTWNPKVSDFGLAKLLGSGANYVTTRVMGTFGFVFSSQLHVILSKHKR